ncbi:sulfatase-like hydrolase/transferase [Opitutales bacterium]|nr:sulfatase-like hydrolase/transferase [Opitutales bacterium]
MKYLPAIITVFLLASISSSAASDRPNILLILTDNQSYFELSSHRHEILQTPHIDHLASESVDFRNFHAPPFCSPSRAELLTGRYALRSGIHTTVGGVSILKSDEATLANYLGGAGYRTAIFGKWHLGYSHPYHPNERGFQEAFIHGGGGIGQMEDYYGNTHIDATWDHNGEMVPSKGYSSDVLFDRASDFIKASKDDPFFCFISTPATHTPYQAEPVAMARIKARGVEARDADLKLFSMIENIDDNVGRMMKRLDDWNLRDNTLVIFATDQGVTDRGAPNPRFDGKREIHNVGYDEKHAVFCMMRFPPLTKAHNSQALAGMVDVAPTILDLCELPQPTAMDGRSLRPLLTGAKEWSDDRKLIIQCPRNRYREYGKNAAVKTQRWRLVGGNELYDIKEDWGQLNNVAADHPDVVESLNNHYDQFWHTLPPANDLLSRHLLGAPEATETRLVCMDWYLGASPWHQFHLARSKENGVWAIDVDQDGRYQFELRWYPQEQPTPIGAEAASIRVGSVYDQKAMNVSDEKVVFELNLQEGQFDLETAFQLPPEAEQTGSFGAYFVYVKYLGS